MSCVHTYGTLEKLTIGGPVDRLAYMSPACPGLSVLDIGYFDETALDKRGTKYWLQGAQSCAHDGL